MVVTRLELVMIVRRQAEYQAILFCRDAPTSKNRPTTQ
jgi:hypothetical protein